MTRSPSVPLSAWTEWQDRCAVALCTPDHQASLQKFAVDRFHHWLRQYRHLSNLPSSSLPSLRTADAWHLFETHLTINATRAGKSYKRWLFARAEATRDAVVDVVQAGATLLMRDVVREHLRREYSPHQAASLSGVVRAGEEVVTLQDLLPGELVALGEVERRELDAHARQQADRWWPALTDRARLILFARASEIPLSHPKLVGLAAIGKSVLHTTWHSLVREIGQRIRAEYPDDDPGVLLELANLTLAELQARAQEWAESEIDTSVFFYGVETAVDPTRREP